ncbi:F-BAR and double SH3 domains protein 1 [Borealophlyctis nickersoniae]|nr:F-BAR and double SH3 domains protein 1 [Borealophlyctis nickersoniae]
MDLKKLQVAQKGQVGKLQLKSDAELELLENLNSYMRSLEKLSKTFATKKLKKSGGASLSQGVGSGEDAESERNVRATYVAFSTLIAESDKQARSRGQMSEQIVADIADIVKEFHKEKAAGSKRHLEFATKYQQELWAAYDELDKAKHAYDKAGKEAESSKKKYDDAMKKPNSTFMKLVTRDSEERVEKLRAKWKAAARRLTDARNDYLLALESVNTLQNLYYKEDLPKLMLVKLNTNLDIQYTQISYSPSSDLKKMDGHYYTLLVTLLNKYSDMESDFAQSLTASLQNIRFSVQRVDRTTDADAFMKENAALFKDPETFPFEKSSGDDTDHLTVDEVTKVSLGQRLARLIARDEELAPSLVQKERELAGVQHLTDVYNAQPAFGQASTAVEQRQEIESSIDLLKAMRSRILAQIQLLKSAGVQPMAPVQPAANSSVIAATPNKGKAVAIYNYDAKLEGETSVKEGDSLAILEDEADGWTKVRNMVSQGTGYVPADYIKITEQASNTSSTAAAAAAAAGAAGAGGGGGAKEVQALYDYKATDEGELSFKAGDMIEVLETNGEHTEDAWWQGRLVRTNQTGAFPVVFTQGWQNVAAGSTNAPETLGRLAAARGGSVTLSPTRGSLSRSASTGGASSTMGRGSVVGSLGRSSTVRSVANVGLPKVKALYDYDATCEGELTIRVGEIITVTNKNTGSEEWWEGEGAGGKGQFPVAFIQTIEDASPTKLTPAPFGISQKSSGFQVKALYDYTGASSDELTFRAGDTIRVTNSSDPDWWDGELGGKTGALPSNYVQRL